MRNISSAFRRALTNDKRDYQNRLRFTLADNTVFDVRNNKLWDDGLQIEDAVSNDNSFQIGAAIINQCKIVLNNIYHDFSEYNFDGAKIVVYTGLNDLDDGSDEEIKLGTYEVDETSYDGSLITLTCLDNMYKFDKAYETNLQFPATLYQIVADACNICGVDLATSSLNFPHKDYIVSDKPSGDNTTFRQVISWTAQIACCFARCNVDGNLEFKWYNTDEFDNFTTGIDGGVFDGQSIAWLSSYMNTDTGMTVLSNTRVDDSWFRINNSIGFEFNGSAMTYLYIASNSRFEFSNSTSNPGSSTSTNYGVNICGRDGQSTSIKYQTISDSSREALKVRFHGYTRYNTTYQTREYELEYEIFFTDLGAIVINFITLPTASGYLGTTSIIENNVTSPFTPTTDNIIALYRGSGNTWTTTPVTTGYYVSGDTADGGTFSPWNTGDEYSGGNFDDFADLHYIQSSYSSHISTDNVVITGVKVIKKIKVDGASDVFEEYTSGTNGYVIVIENNDLIEGTHGQDVADWVGIVVNGVQFRKASLTHPSDPSIEAGDVAIYFDENGNSYPIIVSSTTFTPGNSQKTTSSAETPKKNSSQRFSQATRDYVEIRQRLSRQKTEWEEAVDDLSERIDNASGLYCTEVVEQGATKTYYHNKPILEESDILMLFSTVGFTLSDDGGTTWYGMTVDGQMIATILNTIGVNADWINTGTLSGRDITLGGSGASGSLTVRDASNNTLVSMSKTGVSMTGGTVTIGGSSYSGSLTVKDASNNNLVSMSKTGVTVNGGSINGSTINLGGSGSAGSLVIKDASNNALVSMSKTGASFKGSITSGSTISGATISAGSINIGNSTFVVNTSGNLNCTSVNLQGSIKSNTSSYGNSYVSLDDGDIEFGSATYSGKPIINAFTSDNWMTLQITNGHAHPIIIGSSPVRCGLEVWGNFTCHNTKSRVVEDTIYGSRKLYAYETPTPYFGDIGSGITDDNGEALIGIDDMFDETINTYVEYVVFLQKEGQGDLWIKEKSKDYFIVNGTPNLRFAWELKAVQKKYEYLRLDDYELEQHDYSDEEDVGLSMEEDLKELDNEELFAEELFLNDGLITYAV